MGTRRAVQHFLVPCIIGLVLTWASATPAAEEGVVAGRVEATPTKYLEETVVYLKTSPSARSPRSFDIDQKGMKFIPHVQAIAKGDTVRFLNHDGVDHNVYSPEGGFNLGMIPKDKSAEQKFDAPGAITLLCSVHPEMLGYVFVAPTPYSAVVDKTGRYKIGHVPPGSYQVAVWNSHLKSPEASATVAPGKAAQVDFSVKR